MNRLLDRETLTQLLKHRDGPCLSCTSRLIAAFRNASGTRSASSNWSSNWKNPSSSRAMPNRHAACSSRSMH